MTDRSRQLSIRFNEREWTALNQTCKALGRTRADVIRSALSTSLPFVATGHSINAPRLVMCLERMQAALDVIVHREHADAAEKLDVIAEQRMAEFHA